MNAEEAHAVYGWEDVTYDRQKSKKKTKKEKKSL
jgi:hypothetical protein